MWKANPAKLLLLLAAALPAAAQSQFAVFADQPQGVSQVAHNGTVTMVGEFIGAAVQARLTVSYRGTASAVITSVDRTGSNDFSIAALQLPATLQSQQSLDVNIRYVPVSGNRAQGRVAINFTDGASPPSQFIINLVGITPDLVVSYVFPGGNATLLPDGGLLQFPPTATGNTLSAVIAISNRGTAPGTVTGFRSSGGAFQLSGLPLPPAVIDPGRDLRFNLSFNPVDRTDYSGAMTIDLTGRSLSFNLQGSGVSAVFSYELLQEDGATPLSPDKPVTLPDTPVGGRSVFGVRVTNTGSLNGSIAAINVTGAGYQLADLPVVPLTLAPGNSLTFTLIFAPAQPGSAAGRLLVGSTALNLQGTAVGAALSFRYATTGSSIPVQNNGTLLFNSVQVGRKSILRFTVTNDGNGPASLGNISLAAPSSVFALEGLPALPVTLAPKESLEFQVSFSPSAVGTANATLRVESSSFTLSGTAAAPDPLPAVLLEGPSGQQPALGQPSYTLKLAEPYPINVSGVLTLTFNSEVFANDATVQFSTGGRSVPFTIPANSTSAVFPNNASQIRLQTGSVAGTITLTPSFATEGGVNITPSDPPTIRINVAQAAPEVTALQLGAKSANSFSVLITGYSTSRSITQMELQLTPAAGVNMQATRFTINVESAFLSWYQNAQSQQFGSLFTATLPVTLEGSAPNGGSLVDAIQSVSISLGNTSGSSAMRTLSLR